MKLESKQLASIHYLSTIWIITATIVTRIDRYKRYNGKWNWTQYKKTLIKVYI